MSSFDDRIKGLSRQQLALLALDLKSRLDRGAQPRVAEPLAVVGIGCRFPGANGPDEFWTMLEDGKDAITEVPASRWNVDDYFDPDPESPGCMVTRYGGFLDNIDQFDYEFFGISKREAVSMDPQQRILLEVAWQTLENAAIDPDTLRKSRTGVFVGICNSDFFVRQTAGDIADLDMYVSTGTAHSVASGRLAYVLGLQGPAVSVDTACSSSLVAVHLACQSLRLGECRLALAGGVNLVLLPEVTVSLSNAKMLSPDGRCKAFDEAANGFVRGEGAGLVALKRLKDAISDNDTVLAVINGSASNQDGRSHGLTAPNGPSQEAIILDALANAGIGPDDVSLIEAHGTGTSLGDPIEARALANVFGRRSATHAPLMVGSVKSNIGHAESAAGIAGLIKLVLSVRNRKVPATLHFKSLNSHIDWQNLPLAVCDRKMPWGKSDSQLVGGVSSFGFSGSNAHVVVSSPPARVTIDQPEDSTAGPLVLPLSAPSPDALRALAGLYAERLATISEDQLPGFCRTAALGRAHFKYRLALVATNISNLIRDLSNFSASKEVPTALSGKVDNTAGLQVAFLYPGQGTQYPGMGGQLYQSNSVFRTAIDQCESIVREITGESLREIIFPSGADDRERIHQTEFSQIAIFAIEYSLSMMLQAWNVRPGLVTGHSIGEYAAAVVAGVVDLQSAMRLVIARGKLTSRLPDTGMMAAVFTDEDSVRKLINTAQSKVSVAAVNAPGNVVLSGESTDVIFLLKELEKSGVSSRPLNISKAFHSAAVDAVLDEYTKVLSSVRFNAPKIAVASSVTGKLAQADDLVSIDYWRRHLRQPVRFMDSAASAMTAGYRTFIEVGAHPVLTTLAQASDESAKSNYIPSLQRECDDVAQIGKMVQSLYVAGVALDWNAYLPQWRGDVVDIPNYPFRSERCWPDANPTGQKSGNTGARSRKGLVSRRVRVAGQEAAFFETTLSIREPAFMSDHRVFGRVIMPSPAYIELAANAVCEAIGADQSVGVSIESLAVYEALVFEEGVDISLQTVLHGDLRKNGRFDIFATECDASAGFWTRYASGSISVLDDGHSSADSISIESLQREADTTRSGTSIYADLAKLGLDFGQSFQCLRQTWKFEAGALGELTLPDREMASASKYHMHPALLDGCFHLLAALTPTSDENDPFLLIGIEKLTLFGRTPGNVWAYAVPRKTNSSEIMLADIVLYDESGKAVASIEGIELKRASIKHFADRKNRSSMNYWYNVHWQAFDALPLSTSVDHSMSPALLRSQLTEKARNLVGAHEIAQYESSLADLEIRAGEYVQHAMSKLGWMPSSGDLVLATELMTQLGVRSKFARLFCRMLAILAQDGYLTTSGERYRVTSSSWQESLPADIAKDAELARRCPAELTLLDRCGSQLAEVLTGEADPMDLLFPGGRFDSVEALYRDAPYAKCCNALAADIVDTLANGIRKGGVLRVLEVGAGTGGTSSEVLSRCNPGQTRYCYTDLSPLFLERAAERFAQYEFIEYRTFDIEKSATAQGFLDESFDLVVAANVLHATADLEKVVRSVQKLLVPGGYLLAIEGVRATRWVDLTFGFTDGWWKFTDSELRPDHALLSDDGWAALLAKNAFESATFLDAAYTVPSQQVIVARRNGADPVDGKRGRWIVLGEETAYREGICEFLAENATSVQACHDVGDLPDGDASATDMVIVTEMTDGGDIDQLNAAARGRTQHAVSTLKYICDNDRKLNLHFATRGAQSINSAETLDPSQSALWGLGRVISLEHPIICGILVDGDPSVDGVAAGREVGSVLASPGAEDQLALRGGQRHRLRLRRDVPPAAGKLELRSDATYLVTGGLGGLGLRVGEWLANCGAGRIGLLSRRSFTLPGDGVDANSTEADIEIIESVKRMQAAGASVSLLQGDVADQAFVRSLFVDSEASEMPIKGIMHCAVAMGECPVVELDANALLAMYEAKSRGSMVLDRVSREFGTDFLVFFSSTTSLLGVAGLGHYAAANEIMDAIAHNRKIDGFPALSINWGTWEIMRIASDSDRQEFAAVGMLELAVDDAIGALEIAILSDRERFVVANIDWSALKPIYEARRPRPMIADVSSPLSASETAPQIESNEQFAELLLAVPSSKRRDFLVKHVSVIVGEVLGNSGAVSVDTGFFDMGMDSLMAVELKTRLASSMDCTLPSTLTFNYPNVDTVVGFLLNDVFDTGSTSGELSEQDPDFLAGKDSKIQPTASDLTDAELEDRLASKLRDLGIS